MDGEDAAVAGTVLAAGGPVSLRSSSKGVWSVFSQVRENWLYKHVVIFPFISSFAFHLFPEFHTEEFLNILLQQGKRCSVLYFDFWTCLFNIISSQCEFTLQRSPLQPRAGLAVPRRDHSDSPGDRVCRLGLFCCTAYHNILRYFEMRIFIPSDRKIKCEWKVFLLPFRCGLPFVPGRGARFSGGLSVRLPIAVQQLVVILVLWQEKMKTRLSPLPWAFNLVNCISV